MTAGSADGLFGIFAALARGAGDGLGPGSFYEGLFADLFVARARARVDAAGDADVAFFLDQATRHGGPALELGCGAGRVTLALAGAGLAVDAVDRSAALLGELARRATGAEVTTVQQDLVAFAPAPRRYGLIVVAAAMFPTFLAAGGAPWLARLAAALRPDGALCFDAQPPLPEGLGPQLSCRVTAHPDGPVEVTQGFIPAPGGGHVLNAYAEQRHADGTVRAQLAAETVLALGPHVDSALDEAGLAVAERREHGGGDSGRPPTVAYVCVPRPTSHGA